MFFPLLTTFTSEPNLVGVWQAKVRNGPDVRGLLRISERPGIWNAEIGGRKCSFSAERAHIRFKLPGNEGEFRGRFDGKEIDGHWIQPQGMMFNMAYASPVSLHQTSSGSWSGEVRPLDDQFTMYIVVSKGADGKLSAYFRNPERNLGMLLRIDHLDVEGNSIKVIGTWAGNKNQIELARGSYDEENNILSLYVPAGSQTFDFTRIDNDPLTDFYPRHKPAPPYRYEKPVDKGDGWDVATPEEVGLSRSGIEKFVQTICDLPDNSVHDLRVHSVLLARHGKLVLEEYFHGFSADSPHDLRSAAKSFTSVLTGIALYRDKRFRAQDPVFQILNGGSFPASLEPQKKAITVQNLLTMSSGLDCDDSNSKSPGNEDVMQSQSKEPDWYRYTMALPMAFAPGSKAVYGSAQPNLLAAVLARQTGAWIPDYFRNTLAKPLGISRYYLPLTPTGEAYGGGGMYLTSRDFMKLGQLMLNGGTWKGKRLLSKEFVEKSAQPLYSLGSVKYGYLWWVRDYAVEGKTIRAFFAGGNGGQIVMVMPQLDLVLTATGGNYSDSTTFAMQQEYVPKFVLPLVNGR